MTLLEQLKSLTPTEGEWIVDKYDNFYINGEYQNDFELLKNRSDATLITLAPAMRQELLKMEEERFTIAFYEVIQNRINHFESISHTYEANELKQALKSIQKLIPPIMFKIANTNTPTNP